MVQKPGQVTCSPHGPNGACTLHRAQGATAEGIAAALQELTGESLGTDPSAWRSWAERKKQEAAERAAAAPAERPPPGDDAQGPGDAQP